MEGLRQVAPARDPAVYRQPGTVSASWGYCGRSDHCPGTSWDPDYWSGMPGSWAERKVHVKGQCIGNRIYRHNMDTETMYNILNLFQTDHLF